LKPAKELEMRPRVADATPHAASLIQSLRDIGYSCETALADILDNSITAGARRIEILSDLATAEPAIGILDDGVAPVRAILSIAALSTISGVLAWA
jgi:hypothetical protein